MYPDPFSDPYIHMHTVMHHFCTPTGAMSNGNRSEMNDGAFEGFLKHVESMHTQGKASYEAEFDVSVT